MNPTHSQKVWIVHFFCNPKIDTIPCPSESVLFLHFFATKKFTKSHPSENAWFLQFFVNQSEASKDGVLGVHFRSKEFKRFSGVCNEKLLVTTVRQNFGIPGVFAKKKILE